MGSFGALREHWDGFDGLVHAIAFAPREAIAGNFLDGLSRFGAFMRITFPLLAPGLVASGVYAFLQAWKEDLASPSRTARLKALLGVSEYLASVLAVPTASGQRARDAQHEPAVAQAGGHVEARRH